MKSSQPPWGFNYEEIGCYKLGRLYSETYSSIPYESDITAPISIGRNDSFNPYQPDFGGTQKTLRILTFLHETAHFVHDMSLGVCMEIDYLTDTVLGSLMQILHRIPGNDPYHFPIMTEQGRKRLKKNKDSSVLLDLIEERESLIGDLLSRPSDLQQFACGVNPVFKNFLTELDQLSGIALLEGLVAVKTLVAITLRIKDDEDVAYLADIKNHIPMLPERLPEIYNVARRLFDGTVGELLGISTKYYKDAWPRSYWSSDRAISDEGFLYLADMALHIPPFEYSMNRIRTCSNQMEDFIPANRFVKGIDTLLKKRGFPPLKDPSSPNQFYKTVFDFVANEQDWPSYEETNAAWAAKLTKYKEVRQEATDGYRLRMLTDRHLRPSDAVISDCVDACMRQLVPIFQITPNGFRKLGGFATADTRFYTPFEEADMWPFFIMCRALPLWKDPPRDATLVDVYPTEVMNQDLFRQEIVYRIVSIEFKNSILNKKKYECPFSNLGCNVAIDSCKSITNFSTIPKDECCVQFYAGQKQLILSRINWPYNH